MNEDIFFNNQNDNHWPDLKNNLFKYHKHNKIWESLKNNQQSQNMYRIKCEWLKSGTNE